MSLNANHVFLKNVMSLIQVPIITMNHEKPYV
jgi:hypothetical protein